MHLPHLTMVTMVVKLSSRITMSLLCLATSVPVMPIEHPMSASLRALASFVPSPVTATTSSRVLSMCTRSNLSVGEDLAITCILSSFGPNLLILSA